MKMSRIQISTPYLIILTIITLMFITRSCGEDSVKTDTITVKIPEASGGFNNIKFEEIKAPSIPKILIYSNKEVIVDSRVNDSLALEYLKAKDSIAILKLYMKSITVRDYHKTLNDSNVTVDVKATTTGTLDKLDINYKIKPREIKVAVPTKNTVFAIYAGGGLKNTVVLDQFAVTANLGLQNKKGDILSLQYGTDKSIQLNYSFRILNIKK